MQVRAIIEKGFNLISRMIYYHIAFALQPSSCGKIKAQETEGIMQLILNVDKPIFTDPPVSHHILCMRVRDCLLYSFKLGYPNNKGQDQLWISYHHGGKLGGGLYVSQKTNRIKSFVGIIGREKVVVAKSHGLKSVLFSTQEPSLANM